MKTEETPEYKVRPIEQIIKRYQKHLKECKKEYDPRDRDVATVAKWDRIKRDELAWVLSGKE